METERRREKQIAYNTEHGIDPTPLRKRIADVTDMLAREDIDTDTLMASDYRSGEERRGSRPCALERRGRGQQSHRRSRGRPGRVPHRHDRRDDSLRCHQAAETLQFEQAARLRDEVQELKKELRAIQRSS